MKVTPEEVARHYDEWTPYYMAAFGTCFQANRPTSDDEFLKYVMHRIGLKPGLRILDAGCGVCGPARFFASHAGVMVEALTISAIQAQVASESNAAADLAKNINVTIGDFHHLVDLYGPNCFDRIYFLESLSHSADPAQVLLSAYQVLKPGGYIYIKDFFVRPCENALLQQEVLDVVSRVNQAFKVETPWAAEIIKHLTNAGFHQIFVEHPHFDPDLSRWQAFESAHKFHLYNNNESIHWNEWLELKFRKTAA